MKTVKISKQTKTVNALLEEARHEDLIVRAADGTEFLLSVIEDFDREIAQQHRNKKLMAFLDDRARQARQEKGISLKEAKRQLGLNSHDKKISRRKTGPHSR
jgi:hypothetical protein